MILSSVDNLWTDCAYNKTMLPSVLKLTAVVGTYGNLRNYDGLALQRRFYIAVVESTKAIFPGYALLQKQNGGFI